VAVIPVPRKSNLKPAAETLASLRKVAARTYRTDQRGAITVITDGEDVTVKTER
jgi:beta-lactamase superfamily II metal-dependent hydrolase